MLITIAIAGVLLLTTWAAYASGRRAPRATAAAILALLVSSVGAPALVLFDRGQWVSDHHVQPYFVLWCGMGAGVVALLATAAALASYLRSQRPRYSDHAPAQP